MTPGRPVDTHRDAASAYPLAVARGADHRLTAYVLAALTFVGGLMGIVNLLIDGVIRDGAPRGVYAATMAACLLLSVLLQVRGRAGRWSTFAMVLVGDAIYVAVALCVVDAARFSTPLMLLFPAFVAAWFLGPVELAVNMVVTVLACALGLWQSYPNHAELAVQVAVSAGMLDATTFGVFLLRRRVQRLLAATQTLSITDPLTGLRNRRYLVDQADRVWRQARREGTRVAAMVLDLDHFKRLNDAHGHAAGDAVLRAVARSLSATVRPTDVLARTGGEELVVICLVGDPSEAQHLAERLRAAVAVSRTERGHSVTASIGLAMTRPVDEESPADALWRLVDRADVAMYEAKRQGRDRVASLLLPRPRSSRGEDGPQGQVPGQALGRACEEVDGEVPADRSGKVPLAGAPAAGEPAGDADADGKATAEPIGEQRPQVPEGSASDVA